MLHFYRRSNITIHLVIKINVIVSSWINNFTKWISSMNKDFELVIPNIHLIIC